MTTLVVEGPDIPLHTLLTVICQVADAGCRTTRLVRNHPFDLFLVSFVQNRIGIELALALRAFGSQDVALERVTAFDLARTSLLEALSRSAMSLKLWHNPSSITTYNAQIGPLWIAGYGCCCGGGVWVVGGEAAFGGLAPACTFGGARIRWSVLPS